MPLDTIILEKGYPAYRYKVEDEEKSLSELQLIPSALLIVQYQTVSLFSSTVYDRQCLFTHRKDQILSNYCPGYFSYFYSYYCW